MRRFSRLILGFITGLSLLALLFCYFGRMSSPKEHELLPLLVMGYPIFLAVLCVCTSVWLIRKSKWVLVISAVVISTWSLHSDLYELTPSVNDEDAYRLTSYNCRLFGFYQYEKRTALRDSIMTMLSNLDSDILCFQEFFLTENASGFQTKSIIQEELGPYFEHEKYTHVIKHRQNFGVVTMSRYPIIHKGFISFGETDNNFCIYSDIVFPDGDTVRVFNTHLASIHLRQDEYELAEGKTTELREFMARAEQIISKLKSANSRRAFQIEKILSEVERTPYPVLFAGDFNAPPFSYSYYKTSEQLDDSFKDAGFGLGGTYNGPFPSFRIDHIFHSDGIQVGSYGIEKQKLSDHFPVTIGFDIIDE